MPAQKNPRKKKEEDITQKSLFSFVENQKKNEINDEIEDEVDQEGSENQNNELEEEIGDFQNSILHEDIIRFKKVKPEAPTELIPIPEHLFFKGDNTPFGLKEGKLKIESIKRESISSKYIRSLIEKGKIVQNLERGLLLDVDYDGGQNKAYCKFYDLDSDEIKIWIDTTSHEPYCLSKEKINKLETNQELTSYEGYVRCEEVKKIDLLADQEITMTKLYGKTPTNIGGSGTNIKNILSGTAWEADIRYHLNYIYDRGYIPGLLYQIKKGKLLKLESSLDIDQYEKVANELRSLFKDEAPEIQDFAERYLDIFLTTIPDVKRMAIDIEINLGEYDYKIPDPSQAKQEIISVSFAASDGLKLVYMLQREGFSYGKPYKKFPHDAKVVFFKNEKDLLIETFRLMWDYPIIITFNGDNFDLNYMFHRANKLRVDKDLNPIIVKRGFGFLAKAECNLIKGIHIDLFNFFFNRSISGYAFGGVYQNASLNAISSALLGREKYQHEEEIHEMEYNILSWYNLKDSILTLELTKFNDNTTWNLIILLSRITKMPLHDLIRHQISSWIQNILYFEHRQRNFLIPRRSEISELKKGGFSKSTIEGKGFKGAYVVPPVPGIHYNVVVMDFSSLYPSIIKEYNLSYETVQCSHEDCTDNFAKGVPYHICTHKMGIFAYVVGFFRDIRVKYFKPKSGDKTLSAEIRSYYNTIQLALKVFINASYGVFGSQNFPLFCLPVAESTTGIGQYSIKSTILKAEELKIKVLYGDTDSIFLLMPTKAQLKEIAGWSKKELDLDLEEEKTYQFLALSERKKNYIGIFKDSKAVDIKGLVAKKKNTPEFIKTTFKEIVEILKNITNNEEFLKAKTKIIEIIREDQKKIGKPDGFPLGDYAINIVLQKKLGSYNKVIPQHVRAALEHKKATGKEYQKGEIITFIKSKGAIGAKSLDLAKLQDIDTQKYKELLKSALDQVLDALGISFDEIRGIKKMDAFF